MEVVAVIYYEKPARLGFLYEKPASLGFLNSLLEYTWSNQISDFFLFFFLFLFLVKL